MGNSPKGCQEISIKQITVRKSSSSQVLSISHQSKVSALQLEVKQKFSLSRSFYLFSGVSEMVDFLLTIPSAMMTFLQNNDILTINDIQEVSSVEIVDLFEPMKIIGKGGFSEVVLARKKDTGELFAVKSIEKSSLFSENRLPQIVSEKDILKAADHPFIVKLCMAFQTKHKVHLVMEFCPGGELFFHLQNVKRLTEEQAIFYFSEILLALEYLHRNDIVYRDLKPENVLVDYDGHVKLIDFGLSKQGLSKDGVTFSFCGSPEYMTPEVLNGVSHGRAVDFYGLGALLYEMLVGIPPFYDKSHAQMEWNILNSRPEFPKGLSKTCKDLLTKLLDKDPEKRLGYSTGIEEIKNHAWCKNCDWNKYNKKKIKPPLMPRLRTSNFPKEFTNLPVSPDMLKDQNEEEGFMIQNFDFNTPVKRRRKKVLSIIPEVHESLTEVSSKKTEEKPLKYEEFSEESYVYSNSLESETSIQINEIPSFTPRFFN
jgi:serine/threonine protein kinase